MNVTHLQEGLLKFPPKKGKKLHSFWDLHCACRSPAARTGRDTVWQQAGVLGPAATR